MNEVADHKRAPIILIADDAFVRFVLRRRLRSEGYEVVEAEDGQQALVAFERTRPAIMLLDIMMPVMDGLTALEKLHNLPEAANTLVLMITAVNEEQAIRRAFELGAMDYISKPISYPILRQRVRYLLCTREAELALRRSEERFRSYVENTLDIVAVATLDSELVYVSPSVEQVLGYKPEELTGRRVYEIVHTHDLACIIKNLSSTIPISGIFPPVEYRIRHKDGTWRILESVARTIQDETISGAILAHSHDITARKKVEEALEYRVAFDSLITDISTNLFFPKDGPAKKETTTSTVEGRFDETGTLHSIPVKIKPVSTQEVIHA